MAFFKARKWMALAICPELKDELTNLEYRTRVDKAEIELLTDVNKTLNERIEELDEKVTRVEIAIKDQQDFIRAVSEAEDEEELNKLLVQAAGVESIEELEKTLNDPNGKLVFK